MNAAAAILVVEDQRAERDALSRMLEAESYRVVGARNPREALTHVHESIDLVICDLRLGADSGVDLLRDWRRFQSNTPFIMMTAYGDVPSAVAAMKLGAEDYMIKPVDPEALLGLVNRLLRTGRVEGEVSAHGADFTFGRMRGRCAAMRDLFERAKRAAMTENPVLICGELGTGKEALAKAMHEHSPRSRGPFVSLNLAALDEGVAESELFGHVRDHFTATTTDCAGKFEEAHGGTLFIDEIGALAASTQARLLRAMESRVVSRLGSTVERKVDVRVIAASSCDMAALVSSGEFREDLYYVLDVVALRLPPLRERAEDIPFLVEQYLAESCATLGRPMPSLDSELATLLTQYSWPGNVRQLRNVVESMVMLAKGRELTIADLPFDLRLDVPERDAAAALTEGNALEVLERRAILDTLEQYHGNRTRAADALGISVRTLQRKLKAWGLAGEV